MEFKDLLREAMGDLTQEQLSERSGVHQTVISTYLRGASLPGYSNLVALERTLPRLKELRNSAEVLRAS